MKFVRYKRLASSLQIQRGFRGETAFVFDLSLNAFLFTQLQIDNAATIRGTD